MKNAAELPADLLAGPLAPAPELEDAASAARITRVAQLAERGDHEAAAREAAELIEAGSYDIRLIGYYLFGMFLQRGIGYLPALLGRAAALVTDHLAALRPERRKLQVVSSATAWLFEHVSARLQFHTRQRDATWDAWRAASDAALADAIASGCTKAAAALEAVIEKPLGAAPLARIRRWASEDLRRAAGKREAPAERAPATASGPAEAPRAQAVDEQAEAQAGPPPGGGSDGEPGPGGSADADGGDANAPGSPADAPGGSADAPEAAHARPDDPAGDPATVRGSDDARARDRPGPAGAPDAVVVVVSPALAALQDKLRGFQELVARGELAKAAVVASDIRQTLADFDPIEFFPSLFAGYFKVLHQVIDELTPYLERAGEPSWDALDSYYRADMRAFFED
jgi:hypothetical protein